MDIFDAIADPTRRKIVELLANQGEMTASAISEQFEITPQAISQHLKILREAKLVIVEKRAQQRIYHINPTAVAELEDWTKNLRELWEERFSALDRLLEIEKKKSGKG